MHIARIQDFSGEEPVRAQRMPDNAPTSLQAVAEALEGSIGHLNADELIEGLFRRGYAVVPVSSLPSNLIFKGRQA